MATVDDADPLDALYRRAARDLKHGDPLVATVYVALCDNHQLHCGGGGLGHGERPDRNLYWGGAAGLRAVFDRARGWKRIHLDQPARDAIVERVVYQYRVRHPSARWRRLGVTGGFDLLLLGIAFRGPAIGEAHRRFLGDIAAARGIALELPGGRLLRAGGLGHLVGYAGHNHLLDVFDYRYPALRRHEPLAYFALSCLNAGYLGPHHCGSPGRAVLLTRSLMYPGAPTIKALLEALARADSQAEVYSAGVDAYARMQKRPERVIRAAFIHDGERRFMKLYPRCPSASPGE